ncbi:ABC transporter permease subunit [Streptomyces sp. NPDC057011]|uniref:ABC transporter permease n=1 Tax=unclassified Streptomyces TaxID=2593676 RepID=UPI003630FEB3
MTTGTDTPTLTTPNPPPATAEYAGAPAEPIPPTVEPSPAAADPSPAVAGPAPATGRSAPPTGEPSPAAAGPSPGVASPAQGTGRSAPPTGEPSSAAAGPSSAAAEAAQGTDRSTDEPGSAAAGTALAADERASAPAPTAVSGAVGVRTKAAARGVVRVLKGVVLRTAAVLALVALWEIAPRAGLVDATFLPPISEVAVAWWELAGDGQLADHTQASLIRSLGGFAIAVAVAVPLGLLIGWYRPLADFLGPLLEVFRNTAALALLPVFVLLLGIGETSKVSIVVYACLWPVLLNTISAVRNADPTLVRLARSMDLSTPRLFQKVILPASVPAIFTGIRLAGAVSILVLVAAEMIGAKAGLGYLINASQFNFAIPQMYAGIITISAIGVAFNQLLVTVERRLSLWRVPAA